MPGVRSSFPVFRYFRDPISAGSFTADASAVCDCCRRSRRWVYEAGCYGPHTEDPVLCPWCIADGSAAERFDVTFNSDWFLDVDGKRCDVPVAVREEIERRTPQFASWQEVGWFVCCGDAAEFLGYAGRTELLGEWAEAAPVVRRTGDFSDADWEDLLRIMRADGSPCAYVFRCLHCGRLGGTWDCD